MRSRHMVAELVAEIERRSRGETFFEEQFTQPLDVMTTRMLANALADALDREARAAHDPKAALQRAAEIMARFCEPDNPDVGFGIYADLLRPAFEKPFAERAAEAAHRGRP